MHRSVHNALRSMNVVGRIKRNQSKGFEPSMPPISELPRTVRLSGAWSDLSRPNGANPRPAGSNFTQSSSSTTTRPLRFDEDMEDFLALQHGSANRVLDQLAPLFGPNEKAQFLKTYREDNKEKKTLVVETEPAITNFRRLGIEQLTEACDNAASTSVSSFVHALLQHATGIYKVDDLPVLLKALAKSDTSVRHAEVAFIVAAVNSETPHPIPNSPIGTPKPLAPDAAPNSQPEQDPRIETIVNMINTRHGTNLNVCIVRPTADLKLSLLTPGEPNRNSVVLMVDENGMFSALRVEKPLSNVLLSRPQYLLRKSPGMRLVSLLADRFTKGAKHRRAANKMTDRDLYDAVHGGTLIGIKREKYQRAWEKCIKEDPALHGVNWGVNQLQRGLKKVGKIFKEENKYLADDFSLDELRRLPAVQPIGGAQKKIARLKREAILQKEYSASSLTELQEKFEDKERYNNLPTFQKRMLDDTLYKKRLKAFDPKNF